MNCFQKLLSSWRGTTFSLITVTWFWLWIAFKNYYLRDEEQLTKSFKMDGNSCELLSKIIIFVTRNNAGLISKDEVPVVNCFQKLLSSWRGTTCFLDCKSITVLWIAFKNYYLRDEEQQPINLKFLSHRCELLSKIIIFVTRNN